MLLEQCYQMGPKYQESYKRELHCQEQKLLINNGLKAKREKNRS